MKSILLEMSANNTDNGAKRARTGQCHCHHPLVLVLTSYTTIYSSSCWYHIPVLPSTRPRVGITYQYPQKLNIHSSSHTTTVAPKTNYVDNRFQNSHNHTTVVASRHYNFKSLCVICYVRLMLETESKKESKHRPVGTIYLQ